METSDTSNTLARAYLHVRRAIGIMGTAFPWILLIGCLIMGEFDPLRESISAYYGTVMRDVFVGILVAIGVFLMSYSGYDAIDNVSSWLAGIFAFGVALLPVTHPVPAIGILHFISAALLFVTLAGVSWFLFTKTDKDEKDRNWTRKQRRNLVFRICAVAMVGSIVLIGAYHLFLPDDPFASVSPVYFLEALALMAFGVSWFVKGKTFWKDIEEEETAD